MKRRKDLYRRKRAAKRREMAFINRNKKLFDQGMIYLHPRCDHLVKELESLSYEAKPQITYSRISADNPFLPPPLLEELRKEFTKRLEYQLNRYLIKMLNKPKKYPPNRN